MSPGDQAPDVALSNAGGPSDEAACEVVFVSETPAPDSGATADVQACTVLDDETIEVTVTNSGTSPATYIIGIVYRDEGGNRIADDLVFVAFLRPGETTREVNFVFGESGAVCEVASADRTDVESEIDPSGATCEVTGQNVISGIDTEITITNPDDTSGDFSAEAAVVKDGVRRGVVSAFFEDVGPGETVTADGFGFVETDLAGTTCEVVFIGAG